MVVTEESVRVGKKQPVERVACRAFLNANQTNITSSNWTKVALNALTYDLGNSFDEVTNYRFTVPVSGLYHIIGSIHFLDTSVVADKVYGAGIYKNAALISQAMAHGSYAGYISAKVEDELFLKKADYIELYAYTDAAGNTVDIYGNSTGTYTFLILRLTTKEGIRQ